MIVMLATDLSAIRLFAALRRAAVVIAFLLAGRELASDQIGVSAAVAALLVGLLDKGPSPRSAGLVMLSSTGLFTLVTLTAGLVSHVKVANVVLMALLAFIAGVGFFINSRLTQVFLFAAVMAASFSIRPVGPELAVSAAAAVLLAGLVQSLLTQLSSPIVRDWPERRRVILAMRTTSRLLRDVGQSRAGAYSSAMASRELNEAEQALAGSDLTEDRLDAYRLLLGDVDDLRMEARALDGRGHLGLRAPDDRSTHESLIAAAAILDLAVRALSQRFTAAESECRALDAAVAELSTPHEQTTRTARAIAVAAVRVPTHVRSLVSPRWLRRSRRVPIAPLRDRVRAALGRHGRGWRPGVRLATAAVVGESIGLLLGLSYSSWVAVTAMMVLRPDVGPTVPRIIMRALGVSIGVGLVLILVAMSQQSVLFLIVIIAFLCVFAYTFAQVNNAIMVGSMTMLIVSLLSLAGNDPLQLATARFQDVLIGCLVGTLFAFAIPIWTRSQLTGRVAAYARASAAWMTTVAASTAQFDEDAVLLMRSRAREARATGKAAEANLETALLEPASKRVDIGRLSLVIAWTRRANEAGVAAEVLMRHGSLPGPLATDYATQAAMELTAAADELALIGTDRSGRTWVDPLTIDHHADSSRIGQCLARAANAANAAHRAAARARAVVARPPTGHESTRTGLTGHRPSPGT